MGKGLALHGSRMCLSQTKHTRGFHAIRLLCAVLSHPVASVVFAPTLIRSRMCSAARALFSAEESTVLPCAALFVSSRLTSFLILQRRARWFWVSSAGVIITEQKSRARGFFFFIVETHKDYSGNKLQDKLLARKSGQCLFLNRSKWPTAAPK